MPAKTEQERGRAASQTGLTAAPLDGCCIVKPSSCITRIACPARWSLAWMIGLIRLLFQSDGPSRLPNRTLQRQGKFARAIVRHAQARPPCLDLSAALLGSALPNLALSDQGSLAALGCSLRVSSLRCGPRRGS